MSGLIQTLKEIKRPCKCGRVSVSAFSMIFNPIAVIKYNVFNLVMCKSCKVKLYWMESEGVTNDHQYLVQHQTVINQPNVTLNDSVLFVDGDSIQ